MVAEDRGLGLRIAYQGRHFNGFQLQSKVISVQSEVERALCIVLKKPEIRIGFTSRTDAGVHAWDQFIFVKKAWPWVQSLAERERQRLLRSLSAILKDRVVFWKMGPLRADFNPKIHVAWKEYEYRIMQSPRFDPVTDPDWFWFRPALDLSSLRSMLAVIQGEHDFAAFAKSSGKSLEGSLMGTRRKIFRAALSIRRHPRWTDATQIQIFIRANGFMHQMVRNLVGTLLENASKNGFGAEVRSSPERVSDFKKILLSRDRQRAAFAAPASGLVLRETRLSSGFFRGSALR